MDSITQLFSTKNPNFDRLFMLTVSAIGVARDRAQGHDITITDRNTHSAWDGSIKYQIKPTTLAIIKIKAIK